MIEKNGKIIPRRSVKLKDGTFSTRHWAKPEELDDDGTGWIKCPDLGYVEQVNKNGKVITTDGEIKPKGGKDHPRIPLKDIAYYGMRRKSKPAENTSRLNHLVPIVKGVKMATTNNGGEASSRQKVVSRQKVKRHEDK